MHKWQNEQCCIQSGTECQRQHHNKYVVFLDKLYRTYVGYDERMQNHVECDEAYVCEVCNVE